MKGKRVSLPIERFATLYDKVSTSFYRKKKKARLQKKMSRSINNAHCCPFITFVFNSVVPSDFLKKRIFTNGNMFIIFFVRVAANGCGWVDDDKIHWSMTEYHTHTVDW